MILCIQIVLKRFRYWSEVSWLFLCLFYFILVPVSIKWYERDSRTASIFHIRKRKKMRNNTLDRNVPVRDYILLNISEPMCDEMTNKMKWNRENTIFELKIAKEFEHIWHSETNLHLNERAHQHLVNMISVNNIILNVDRSPTIRNMFCLIWINDFFFLLSFFSLYFCRLLHFMEIDRMQLRIRKSAIPLILNSTSGIFSYHFYFIANKIITFV